MNSRSTGIIEVPLERVGWWASCLIRHLSWGSGVGGCLDMSSRGLRYRGFSFVLLLRTRKLHKKRRVIEDLVIILRVEPAFVPILSFKLKGLRSRLGSQKVRVRKKELIKVLLMKEQS